ncbi:MAG TPA: FoF1 ATP synthase subunit a [bacterium]|nr:FoF1 ATP synthase subunit a [bacterium]
MAVPAASHDTHAEASHESTIHLPGLQGEAIPGWEIAGVPVTNTIFSTWLFMAMLFIAIGIFNFALRSEMLPRVKQTGISLLRAIDDMVDGFIRDRKFSRAFFPVIVGFFLLIALANITSLFFDWLVLVSAHHSLGTYLRPINSDLNTTLAMAVLIILLSHVVAVVYKGPVQYLKGYFFNFSGHNLAERCINVFVGWLHLVGEFSKLLSLSFRLFGNIFAGVVLISVMAFLLGKLSLLSVQFGQIAVLPFWFFELFVALVQAFIFFILTSIYFSEAKDTHAH